MTPWTAAGQTPLSMGFPRQEYWSGLPFPSPRNLPDPGIKPTSPALGGRFFTTKPPEKPLQMQETQETQVRPLAQEDPLEEGMATHSSILAWRIPWTEEPSGL